MERMWPSLPGGAAIVLPKATSRRSDTPAAARTGGEDLTRPPRERGGGKFLLMGEGPSKWVESSPKAIFTPVLHAFIYARLKAPDRNGDAKRREIQTHKHAQTRTPKRI